MGTKKRKRRKFSAEFKAETVRLVRDSDKSVIALARELVPKPRKRKIAAQQPQFVFDEGKQLSTTEQQYDPTSIINQVRNKVDAWRLRSTTGLNEVYMFSSCDRAENFAVELNTYRALLPTAGCRCTSVIGLRSGAEGDPLTVPLLVTRCRC